MTTLHTDGQEQGKDTATGGESTPLAAAVAAMGALPVPLGHAEPAGLPPELRATIAEQLGDAKPARDGVLVSLAQSVKDRAEHDHSGTADWDWYCLNLSGYMGDRMAPVLRRLVDAESERDALRARVADQAPVGESTPRCAYLARHQELPAPLGWYGRPEAARAHCEAALSAEHPADVALVWGWIEDDEDGVAELVATIGKTEQPTGYSVITLELPDEYDAGADW